MSLSLGNPIVGPPNSFPDHWHAVNAQLTDGARHCIIDQKQHVTVSKIWDLPSGDRRLLWESILVLLSEETHGPWSEPTCLRTYTMCPTRPLLCQWDFFISSSDSKTLRQ